MADEKNEKIAGPPAKSNSLKSALAQRVIKQGDVVGHGLVRPAPPPAMPAGQYKVLHGTVLLGHEADGPVYAHPGAIVQLTDDEAPHLVATKVVEPFKGAAA